MPEIKPEIESVPKYKLDSLSRKILDEARERKFANIEAKVFTVEVKG